MSLRLPPVTVTTSGTPRPSQITWCLEPVLPRSTGLGPVASPPFRGHVGGVHDHPRPVDQRRAVQMRQQLVVDLVEHPGVLPVP